MRLRLRIDMKIPISNEMIRSQFKHIQITQNIRHQYFAHTLTQLGSGVIVSAENMMCAVLIYDFNHFQ